MVSRKAMRKLLGGPDTREICNTPKWKEERWAERRGLDTEKGNRVALEGGDTDHILYQAARKA